MATTKFHAANGIKEEFEANVRQFKGATSLAPVFPIGDALLEPFWPQGLGSNRGFHSALDAAWAAHVLRREGLDAALLERGFCYDVMNLAPMGFSRGIIQPGFGWTAELSSRYIADVVKSVMRTYEDTSAKRMKKGRSAIPARYLLPSTASQQWSAQMSKQQEEQEQLSA